MKEREKRRELRDRQNAERLVKETFGSEDEDTGRSSKRLSRKEVR